MAGIPETVGLLKRINQIEQNWNSVFNTFFLDLFLSGKIKDELEVTQTSWTCLLSVCLIKCVLKGEKYDNCST